MGYANEVGEAFRHIYPKFVVPSYGVAFVYVGCDTVDKTYREYRKSGSIVTSAKVGIDAFIWQSLASVLIPGKVIHLVASAVNHSVNSPKISSHIPTHIRTWSPTIIGLAAIPAIIHPIDSFVDYCMDNSVRKYI